MAVGRLGIRCPRAQCHSTAPAPWVAPSTILSGHRRCLSMPSAPLTVQFSYVVLSVTAPSVALAPPNGPGSLSGPRTLSGPNATQAPSVAPAHSAALAPSVALRLSKAPEASEFPVPSVAPAPSEALASSVEPAPSAVPTPSVATAPSVEQTPWMTPSTILSGHRRRLSVPSAPLTVQYVVLSRTTLWAALRPQRHSQSPWCPKRPRSPQWPCRLQRLWPGTLEPGAVWATCLHNLEAVGPPPNFRLSMWFIFIFACFCT